MLQQHPGEIHTQVSLRGPTNETCLRFSKILLLSENKDQIIFDNPGI